MKNTAYLVILFVTLGITGTAAFQPQLVSRALTFLGLSKSQTVSSDLAPEFTETRQEPQATYGNIPVFNAPHDLHNERIAFPVSPENPAGPNGIQNRTQNAGFADFADESQDGFASTTPLQANSIPTSLSASSQTGAGIGFSSYAAPNEQDSQEPDQDGFASTTGMVTGTTRGYNMIVTPVTPNQPSGPPANPSTDATSAALNATSKFPISDNPLNHPLNSASVVLPDPPSGSGFSGNYFSGNQPAIDQNPSSGTQIPAVYNDQSGVSNAPASNPPASSAQTLSNDPAFVNNAFQFNGPNLQIVPANQNPNPVPMPVVPVAQPAFTVPPVAVPPITPLPPISSPQPMIQTAQPVFTSQPPPSQTMPMPAQAPFAQTAPVQVTPAQTVPVQIASAQKGTSIKPFNPRQSQYEPGVLAEIEPIFGAALLARVGTESILMCDVLPEVQEIANTQWMEVVKKNTQNGGPTPTLDDERMFKSQFIANVFSDILERKIETAMLSNDMAVKAQAEMIAPYKQQFVDLFNSRLLPNLMKEYQVTNRFELDAKLQKSYGVSLERKKEMFVREMLADGWLSTNAKTFDMIITHDDMLDYYNEHKQEYKHTGKARWEELAILFSETPNKEEARNRIAELGNRVVKNRENFSDVAKQGSQGVTAYKGGKWDWCLQGALRSKELDQAIFSLPVGAMSQIIADDYGFHIIRVIERQDEYYTPFDELYNQIKKRIETERSEKAKNEYKAELRKKYPPIIAQELPSLIQTASEAALLQKTATPIPQLAQQTPPSKNSPARGNGNAPATFAARQNPSSTETASSPAKSHSTGLARGISFLGGMIKDSTPKKTKSQNRVLSDEVNGDPPVPFLEM
ncbi:MAG: peptidylprolyl isomerase [Planctomycetaceae bacterium]|nr:peptidylprolyl isomerase [Planctomycetaceae bacterium]